jgi:hypothetical protein
MHSTLGNLHPSPSLGALRIASDFSAIRNETPPCQNNQKIIPELDVNDLDVSQIDVANVDAIHDRARTTNREITIPLEEQWYRIDDHEGGNRQFVIADPDGYLLRFFQDLGTRMPAEVQDLS